MAVKKSYTLASNISIQLGASEYEGEGVPIDAQADCLNLFIDVSAFAGIPGDSITPVLQTSPDNVSWTTLFLATDIENSGAHYFTPSPLYIKPDNYIRIYFVVTGFLAVDISTVQARVGTFRRRGRYGR